MDRVAELIGRNAAYLARARSLVERLDDEAYTARGPGYEQGPVGTQVRHIVDYYTCFLRGQASGHVDYDRRDRDQAVESDRRRALTRLAGIAAGLGRLGSADGARPLTVRLDDVSDGAAATPSSLERELLFLTSHTIHHFAVIALVLRAQGLDVDGDFGVAPSTLKHWDRASDCAR